MGEKGRGRPGEPGDGGPFRQQMSRRRFLAWTARSLVLGVGAYSFLLEPSLLKVSRHKVGIPPGLSGLDGLRIGVAGDFHLSGMRSEAVTRRAVALLNRERPDLVLIPGDVAGRGERNLETAVGLISEITARLGVYTVPGNHEHFYGIDEADETFRAHGVPFLRNRSVILDSGIGPEAGRLVLAGLDDALMGQDDAAEALSDAPKDLPVLLLVHEPDAAERAARAGGNIILQVSGHSHGGQVRIPFAGPVVLPPMGRNYPSGLSPAGAPPHPVFTTTGTGVLAGPRFWCPPEVAILTLKAGLEA